MNIFEEIESEVRSYCRSFPAVFEKAVNAHLYDVSGKVYIDFFALSGNDVPLVNLRSGPRRYAPAEGRKFNSGTSA